MEAPSDTLARLRKLAVDIAARHGRDQPTPDTRDLEVLVLEAHGEGCRLEDIVEAAHLSYWHVCQLLSVSPPDVEVTADGRMMWRISGDSAV